MFRVISRYSFFFKYFLLSGTSRSACQFAYPGQMRFKVWLRPIVVRFPVLKWYFQKKCKIKNGVIHKIQVLVTHSHKNVSVGMSDFKIFYTEIMNEWKTFNEPVSLNTLYMSVSYIPARSRYPPWTKIGQRISFNCMIFFIHFIVIKLYIIYNLILDNLPSI